MTGGPFRNSFRMPSGHGSVACAVSFLERPFAASSFGKPYSEGCRKQAANELSKGDVTGLALQWMCGQYCCGENNLHI